MGRQVRVNACRPALHLNGNKQRRSLLGEKESSEEERGREKESEVEIEWSIDTDYRIWSLTPEHRIDLI